MKVSWPRGAFPRGRLTSPALPPPLTESFDDLRVVANHSLDRVALDRAAAGREPEGRAALLVPEQVLQETGERTGIPEWRQHAGLAHELGRPAPARCDHGPPARERFDQRQTEHLDRARVHDARPRIVRSD